MDDEQERDSGEDPEEPADLVEEGGSNTQARDDGTTHEVVSDADRGDRGGHISWDVDAQGEYIEGTGHTTDHASDEKTDWVDTTDAVAELRAENAEEDDEAEEDDDSDDTTEDADDTDDGDADSEADADADAKDADGDGDDADSDGDGGDSDGDGGDGGDGDGGDGGDGDAE